MSDEPKEYMLLPMKEVMEKLVTPTLRDAIEAHELDLKQRIVKLEAALCEIAGLSITHASCKASRIAREALKK